MELGKQQAQAVDLVGAFLKDASKQVFYLGGYAGTGKTTIAKHLRSLLDGPSVAATFTGKAASVLTKKGVVASTIHSLTYKVVPPSKEKVLELQKKLSGEKDSRICAELVQAIREANRPHFELKSSEESDVSSVDLVIIDEVSMVGEEMGVDLLSFGTKVLVLGDPGQLPPITGAGYFTSGDPDFMLTEIHRQALGNPIISMATMVRQGNRLRVGRYGESRVYARHEGIEAAYSADQVICGRNATRKSLNSSLRDRLGFFGTVPVGGDKVICLRNNPQKGLLNGTQWLVDSCTDEASHLSLSIRSCDYPEREPIEVSAHPFDTEFDKLMFWQRAQADEFDFGNAITCHKSQGSQWTKVYVQDESWCFRKDASKWLYTALTRAEEKVEIGL